MSVVLASAAQAGDNDLLRSRYLDRIAAVYAVGDFLMGSDATMLEGAHPYRRFGGAVGVGFGLEAALTSFGALAGFEVDAELGATSGNLHSDGVVRYNETKPRSEETPPIGLTLKLGGRVKVSPIWFHFSDTVGLRLGVMTGLAVDWAAVEAYNQVGSVNFGAQAVLQVPSFSLTLSALYTPPGGDDWELARVNASLTLVMGSFVLGGRATLTNARPRAVSMTHSLGLVAEQSFSAFIGIALGGS